MSGLVMAILDFILSFFFATLTKKKTGVYLRINVIYSFIWSVISLLGFINPLGLIAPSNAVFGLVTASIVLFNLIYLFSFRKQGDKPVDYSSFFIRNRRIVTLNVIAYVLLIPVLISAVGLLLNNGFNLLAIRDEIYVGITDSNNSVYSILCRTIPTAIFLFTELISTYYAITKKNKAVFALGIVDLLVGTVVFGGRNFILYYVIFYFVHFLNLRKELGLHLNKKVLLFGILALAIVTGMRDVNGLSLFETITLYYAGSLSFLEYIVQNPVSYGLMVQHYGLLTFGFITEPIIIALNVLLGTGLKVPSYYFNTYAQKFVNISDIGTLLYNNNSTFFYPFMLDFGISGAILGAFIYFSIIIFAEKLNRKGNLKLYFVSVFLYSSVINSSISYKLIGLSATIIIVLCLACIGKKRGRKNE